MNRQEFKEKYGKFRFMNTQGTSEMLGEYLESLPYSERVALINVYFNVHIEPDSINIRLLEYKYWKDYTKDR